jgi:dihydropyrimidinase
VTRKPFDLVIRAARVATASDTFDADSGVKDGRNVQLGAQLAA